MSSSFSIGQMAELAQNLEVAGFTPFHLSKLCQLGPDFSCLKAYLEGQATIEVKGFNLAELIGIKWRFAKPPIPAKIRSAKDVQNVSLFYALRNGEEMVTGEETLRRFILEDKIPLGTGDFHFFLNNKDLIPVDWKKPGTVLFDADVLIGPDGNRYTIYSYWNGRIWGWGVRLLKEDRNSECRSAVISSYVLGSGQRDLI